MDLRYLQTFQTIVRLGSFQAASFELDYAQSSISIQIQKLESELGVQLFERHGKKIRLTEAGRLLHEQAAHLLNGVDYLKQSLLHTHSGYSGHLRIGAIEPSASVRLPGLLIDFCEQRPNVRLTFEIGSTQTLCQKITMGTLDIGICSIPDSQYGLVFEPLIEEKLALLIPEKNPLSIKEKIFMSDLIQHKLILTQQACDYRILIKNFLAESGYLPNSSIEVSRLEVVKRFVQNNLGIAFLPEIVADPLPSRTVLRRIEGHNFKLPIGLVYKLTNDIKGKALEVFIEMIKVSFCK